MQTLPSPDLLDRLAALTPMARDSAAEAEQHCRLSPALVAKLVEDEFFRLWIPRSLGGLELSLPQALQVYEAAGRLDGSLGWAIMIGAGGGLFGANLSPAAAETVFRRADAVIAGSGTGTGRAEAVPGGYHVSGRWRYASGAHYATTFTTNCIVTRAGMADGPEIRAMAFEPAQVRIVPAWNALGLRGTGSDDIVVEDAFVSQERSFTLAEHPRETGRLYQLSFDTLTELPVSAVALGIARGATDAFAALMQHKPAPFTTRKVGEFEVARAAYAVAMDACSTGSERLQALAARVWTDTKDEPTREVCVRIIDTLLERTAALARCAGMSAVVHGDAFGRAWRDLQTLAAHASVSPLR